MQSTETKTAKDPVCNMEVDVDLNENSSNFMGKVYYFCCQKCKEEFDKDPLRYGARGKVQSRVIGSK